MNGKAQRRRHAATAGRRVAGSNGRHRKPIPQRLYATAYSPQPGPSQPVQVQAQDVPSGPFDFKFGQVEEDDEEPDDQVRHSPSARSFRVRPCYMRVVLIDHTLFS